MRRRRRQQMQWRKCSLRPWMNRKYPTRSRRLVGLRGLGLLVGYFRRGLMCDFVVLNTEVEVMIPGPHDYHGDTRDYTETVMITRC